MLELAAAHVSAQRAMHGGGSTAIGVEDEIFNTVSARLFFVHVSNLATQLTSMQVAFACIALLDACLAPLTTLARTGMDCMLESAT